MSSKDASNLILRDFPEFKKRGEALEYLYSDPDGINHTLLWSFYSSYFIDKFREKDIAESARIIATVDHIFSSGDEETKEHILYSFLENLDLAQADYKNIKSQLSTQLLQALNTIEDFWQGKEVKKIF